jgi:hypothetical protein
MTSTTTTSSGMYLAAQHVVSLPSALVPFCDAVLHGSPKARPKTPNSVLQCVRMMPSKYCSHKITSIHDVLDRRVLVLLRILLLGGLAFIACWSRFVTSQAPPISPSNVRTRLNLHKPQSRLPLPKTLQMVPNPTSVRRSLRVIQERSTADMFHAESGQGFSSSTSPTLLSSALSAGTL